MALVVAPSAHAWPAGTVAITQEKANLPQTPDPQSGYGVTVLGHGYGYTPLVANAPLSGPQLKIHFFQGMAEAVPAHTVTLMDFTGDDHPDILVDAEMTLSTTATGTFAGKAYVYDVSKTPGIDTCASVPARSSAIFDVDTSGTTSYNNWRLVSTIPLAKLATDPDSPIEGGTLKNQPRILSFPVRAPSPPGPAAGFFDSTKVVPQAAATSFTTKCPNDPFYYDFSKGTARYPAGAATTADITHTDPVDNPDGNADLTRVAMERRNGTGLSNDAVENPSTATPQSSNAVDLKIDFASADKVASDTWIFSNVWIPASSSANQSRLGRVRTESAGSGRVKVTLSLNTQSLAWPAHDGSGKAADYKTCLSTGAPSGPSLYSLSYTVPLTVLPNGDRRVSIPMDNIVPTTGYFRFHTISDPGQYGLFAPIDHAPLFAGYSVSGTGQAAGCDAGGGTPGADVYIDRSFTLGELLPKVELIPSTTTPTRDTSVNFSLGQTAAGTRRCNFTPNFAPTDCSTLTGFKYTADTTAYLAVHTDNGPWDQTQVDLKFQNSQPTAAISRVGTTPAQGTDGSYAIVQGAAVSIPLKVTGADADPAPAAGFTYRWTLDGAATGVSTSTYTPSFSTPGTRTVRAYVSDDSGQANAESLAAVLTINVVRSPQGEVSIVRPARVSTGQPFDIEAQTTPNTTGFQALTWQWDLDGNATTNFDPARNTRQLTNVVIPTVNPAYLVRVRATDAGGRTADSTINLNVRRVNEAPPSAKFTSSPSAPKSGDPVSFDGSTSQLSYPDGTLQGPVGASPSGVRFHWNFGDGTPEVVTTTATTVHTYAGSGRPKATLVIEDVRATPSTSSDPAEQTIAVAPGSTDANAPVAKLVRQDPAPSEPVFANRPVTLSASESSAAAGHAPLTFAFDLDGNGTFEKDSGVEPTITFTPATAAPLTVRVKVTDGLSSAATATIDLDVKPDPVAKPTAVLAGPAEVVLDGVTVDAAYDATGSKGNNLDPRVNYDWDLDNNGSFETATGTDPKLKTTFKSSGEKVVKVRVSDRYGNTAEASTTTIVRSIADIAAGCTGDQSFREVTYENVRLRGCVQSVKRPSSGNLFVITGKVVSFNGMILRSTTGARPAPRPFADCAASACKELQDDFNAAKSPWAIVLDTGDGSLRSNSATALRASGVAINLPLLSGPLDVSLPKLASDGFTLGTPPDADLGGFPLGGGVTLKFPSAGETSITLIVGLPSIVGGITGQATVRVTSSGGVVLDELKVDVGEVALGKLTLGNLSFAYNNQLQLWKGGASITLPSPKPLTLSAEVIVQANRFKSIKAEVAGINTLIAQGIYLQAIRAGVAVDPLDLTAGISVSAGPAVKKKAIVSLDGDLRLKFPSPAANYYLFALSGKLKLADFQLATAFAQFSSNGFFELGGGIDARVSIGYAKAYIKGWMTSSAFNIDGDASVGVTLGGTDFDLFGGHITMSSTGFGACGGIPIIGLEGGFGHRWEGGTDAFWGCDLSPYRATRPADAPATLAIRAGQKAVRTDLLRGRLLLAGPQGHQLTIPADQEKVQMSLTGATAPPRVSIVDKTGKVLLSTPADGSDVLTKEMLVKADPAAKTTTILWKAPPAGKVWIVAQAGASPVSKVDAALPAPDRKLDVKVTGSGRDRTLTWKITPALVPGERISLAEEGTGAGTEIVSTDKSTGSTPFTPQGGAGGKRTITAVTTVDGLPSPSKLAATYVAPAPPAPARPASVKLTRSSSAVTVRWSPGKGGAVKASKWRLQVSVPSTKRKQLIVLDAAKRSARIADVNPGDAVSVRLTGSDAAGVEGPVRSGLVKAGLKASYGKLAQRAATQPSDIVVRRIKGGKLRVSWKSDAFVRGWSIRVSGADHGRRKGAVTLLRTSGEDHTVDFAKAPAGDLRVSVIGRQFRGTVTRKDVQYIG